MRQKDLKYFGDVQSGRMNSDDSPFAVTTNEWVNAQNIRSNTTDKGATGIVESVGGNVEIPQAEQIQSVIIGTQKWSLQNLDVTTYRNGDPIPEVTDPTAWNTTGNGAWCWYNNDDTTGIKLYNWYAVNDPRGLAPQGWWIPTQYEWRLLSSSLGGDTVSGGHLKEANLDHWNSPNTGADNSSGFTAWGTGIRDSVGFSLLNEQASIWTSSQPIPGRAISANLRYDSANLQFANEDWSKGCAVRIVTFNSQYITIGSIEDTENKRFVYFDYDTVRSHLYPINSIQITVFSSGDTNIASYDDRINLLKPGDNIIIAFGANAGSYNIVFIERDSSYGYYKVELGVTLIAEDIRTDILYYVNGEDKIVCMNTETNIQYNVLLSSQVLGGLNFDKNSLIHSAHIQNNILSFPDGTNNEPRKLNIESGIKGNYPSFVTDEKAYNFPLNFWEITMIKKPPIYSPSILKNNIGTESFIFNQSFEFAYQYKYYDRETTTIGLYSVSSRFNGKDETYNNIKVSMNLSEFIPDNVKIVNLIVRSSDSNYAFIAKTWDKSNYIELNDILLHNGGVNALTYNFNNTTVGEVIPENDVLRPFDNVPIYSQTHEIAKQRYFFANNIDGYDAPKNTSMILATGSYIHPTLLTQTAQIFLVRYGNQYGDLYGYAAWALYIPWASPSGWYLVNGSENIQPGVRPLSYSTATPRPYPTGAAPISTNFGNLTYKGSTFQDFVNNTRPSGYTNYPDLAEYVYNNTIPVISPSVPFYNAFSQLSSYRSGIVFYDYAMRKCGVVTNDNCVITTPARDFSYSQAIDSFLWTLNPSSAQAEIPEWAYYYAPVLTKNQTKRFFISSFTNEIKYASKDAAGAYVYTSTIFSPGTTVAIALNTNALNQSGLGYVYQEGDICILTKFDSTIYQSPVIGQDGNYILLSAKDIGNTNTANFVYEIYSQYKTSLQEPYYEVGQIYNVSNPNTTYRSYSQLYGYFNADTYIINRNFNSIQYYAGAMSPNDLYYKTWVTDSGKPNIITKLGQANNNTEILWSDTYISGTQINGSSTFRLGSQEFVYDECGSINKLQNTSKIIDQGSVILALCANETNSIYLGETQILDNTGATQFFSAGTGVINTINILKGNYGCIDPASVVQYRGSVYYFDANNGRWVQYSTNGLDNIASLKMSRFWKNWSYKYMSMSKSQIEAFGDRPYVFATVDPGHDELLVSIPKLSDDPPKGFLPDYPSIVYPFDILDYRGKTISYKLGTGAIVQPHWQSAYTFNPEYFCTIQNRLFSFKNGNAWEHNQYLQNDFYGVYSPSQIMFTSNILPQIPKVYDNFLSESNIIPNFIYFYNEFPYLQTSDLLDTDFVEKEGIWYAQILRNKVVPTNSGNVYTGLLTAEVMRNTNMYVLAEYSPTLSPLQLRIIQLGMSISRGHLL